MPNLLDTIRQNTGAAVAPQGVTDQDQTVAGLLRAKSGKAVSGGDVGASNLGETGAVDTANSTIKNQVAPQAQLQQTNVAQAASSQEQQTGLQKAEIAQNRTFNTVQDKVKTEALLQGFEQNKGQLDYEKNKAAVSQFAQNLRLSNQQYVDDLSREGQKQRLDNGNDFMMEYANTAFDNDKAVQGNKFDNESVVNDDKRDWEKKLGSMSVDEAWILFNQEQKANTERQKFQAIGSLVSAGAGAYGSATAPAAGAGAAGANAAGPTGTLGSQYGAGNLGTSSTSAGGTGFGTSGLGGGGMAS